MNELMQPDSVIKLLYVTPEKLARAKRFVTQLDKLYNAGLLSRLVVDESHCASGNSIDYYINFLNCFLFQNVQIVFEFKLCIFFQKMVKK